MQKSTMIRTTVAAGVAGLGLSLGGIALATADDGNGSDNGSTTPGAAAVDGRFPGGPGGPGGQGLHRMGPGGDLVAELAEALDVSEDDVEAALEAVREELAPEPRAEGAEGEAPAPPTQEEMEERRDAFAEALAAELGVSADDVTAALEELHADHEAAARSMLARRLTAAVQDGTLTRADRASVLKAFDAGVLGGPGAGPGFGGPPR